MSKRKRHQQQEIFSLLDRLLIPVLTPIIQSFLGVLGIQDVCTRSGPHDITKSGLDEMYFHPNGEIWCLAQSDPGVLVRAHGLFPGQRLSVENYATDLEWPEFISFRKPRYDVIDTSSYPASQTVVYCHSNNGLHFGLIWKEVPESNLIQFDVQIRLVHLDKRKRTLILSQSGFQGPHTYWSDIACGWDGKQEHGIAATLEDSGNLRFVRFTNQEHQKLQWMYIETGLGSGNMHLLVCAEHDLACIYDAFKNKTHLISLAIGKPSK